MRLRRRTAMRSMPSAAATRSIVVSSAKLVGDWPKPRTASCGVLLVVTLIASYSTLLTR